MVNRTVEDVMEALSEPNVIPLVLFLDEREREETVQVDLKEISKGIPKLHETAERLQDLGIVEISIVNKPRRTIQYKITDKGSKLAGAFRQAQSIAMAD